MKKNRFAVRKSFGDINGGLGLVWARGGGDLRNTMHRGMNMQETRKKGPCQIRQDTLHLVDTSRHITPRLPPPAAEPVQRVRGATSRLTFMLFCMCCSVCIRVCVRACMRATCVRAHTHTHKHTHATCKIALGGFGYHACACAGFHDMHGNVATCLLLNTSLYNTSLYSGARNQ